MRAVGGWFHVDGHVLPRTSLTNARPPAPWMLSAGNIEHFDPVVLNEAQECQFRRRRTTIAGNMEHWFCVFLGEFNGHFGTAAKLSPMEKTTVPSESRAFHSVRRSFSVLGVSSS